MVKESLNVSLEVGCPKCGYKEFSSVPYKGEYTETVFWCLSNRTNANRCYGRVCYCKKCEKYYPDSNFGFHAGAYECKTCGAVQWELTDVKKEEQRQEEIINRVRRHMMNY